MEEVINFLKESPIQYLATVGLEGNPRVRPFQFMLEKERKLYFCTSNKKQVYQEMQKNPNIEISTSNKEGSAWLRIRAKVKFSENLEIKEKIIQNNELVKSIYHTGNNPSFEIFYLEEGKAEISDFSGNPPRIYHWF